MRIGIDARMLGPEQTGIGVYIRNIIERVPALDPGNRYYVFLREPFFSSWRPTSSNVTKVRSSARWYGYSEQLFFPFQLLAYRLDLAHFPNFNVPILYPKKYVVTIHDITPKFFHGHRMTSWVRRAGFSATFNRGMRGASTIIAVSQHTKSDITAHIQLDPATISVIYNGFERRFLPGENYDTLAGVHERFGIAKPYLFFAGAWRNHKNIVGLVEAFHMLRTRYNHDIQLVLGGSELTHYPEPRMAWERLGISEHIILPGFLSDADLTTLYRNAQAYVVPSFYEGFGLNGLEAMDLGIPVASSNATALPEVYGDAAHYFDPHDPSDMARAIHEVLSNESLRALLKEQGYKRVELYSWDRCARQTAQVYREVTTHFHEKNHSTHKENNGENG